MPLLESVLAYWGAFSGAASVVSLLRSTIENQFNCSVDQLFMKCYSTAARRQRIQIAKENDTISYDDLELNNEVIEKAIKYMGDLKVTEGIAGHREVYISKTYQLFRGAISCSIVEINEDQLDQHYKTIMQNALADFFKRLPSDNIAISELSLTHFKEASDYYVSDEQFREDISITLGQILKTQKDIEESIQYLNPTIIQKESTLSDLKNPFRIVKSEDFDQDYPLIARLFRRPYNYDLISGRDNLILAGGRGCGKSMILRALSAQTSIEMACTSSQECSFAASNLDFFGIYLKLARGYFNELSQDSIVSSDTALQLFQHVINMQLLKSTIDCLLDCRDNLSYLVISQSSESLVCTSIATLITGKGGDIDSFSKLRKLVMIEERNVGQFLGRLRINQDANYDGHFTYVHNFPNDFCKLLVENIEAFQGCRIYFLLDEFENLTKFQQTVINTITKLRPQYLTIKLATRSLGVKSTKDLQNEPIQIPRDYQTVSLDWDSGDTEYTQMLFDISEKRLQAAGFNQTDIRSLFPSKGPFFGSDKEEIIKSLKDFLQSNYDFAFDSLEKSQKQEWQHRLDYAMLYRLNRTKTYPKVYTGFEDIVMISSGIISNYLEVCRVALYLADADGIDCANGEPIEPYIQNEAVYTTSKAQLNWIAKNIPNTGPTISSLVFDLGDIIRTKLLYHRSEPESGKIQIQDAASLDDDSFIYLAKVLDDATRWSVLHMQGRSNAYLPRHVGDTRADEYTLNRIFVPGLKISHRYRWRTTLQAGNLKRLISPQHKEREKAALINASKGTGDRVDSKQIELIRD